MPTIPRAAAVRVRVGVKVLQPGGYPGEADGKALASDPAVGIATVGGGALVGTSAGTISGLILALLAGMLLAGGAGWRPGRLWWTLLVPGLTVLGGLIGASSAVYALVAVGGVVPYTARIGFGYAALALACGAGAGGLLARRRPIVSAAVVVAAGLAGAVAINLFYINTYYVLAVPLWLLAAVAALATSPSPFGRSPMSRSEAASGGLPSRCNGRASGELGRAGGTPERPGTPAARCPTSPAQRAMPLDIPAGSVLYREGDGPRCGLLVRGLARVFLAARTAPGDLRSVSPGSLSGSSLVVLGTPANIRVQAVTDLVGLVLNVATRRVLAQADARVGGALLRAGYVRCTGWSAVGLTGVLTIAYLLAKDMPPLAHYLVTMALGAGLRFSGPVSQATRR